MGIESRALLRLLLAVGILASSGAMAQKVTYSYDALGRLTAAANPAATSNFYAYDAAGNRTQQITCGAGLVLASGQTLVSANGHYTLNMQSTDGNLVVYGPNGPTWSTNTAGHAGAYAAMKPNGQLTVYAPQGNVLWVSDNYEGPCSTLSMQNDGNLVIYDAGGTARWGTLSASIGSSYQLLSAPPSPAPAGIGQSLMPGQQLVSADGRFVLQFQNNGNLVIMFGQTVLWSLGLNLTSPASASMQFSDGNFVISSTSGPVWSAGTNGHPGDYLVMQTDGDLVIYAPAVDGGWALWWTGTGGH